MGAQDRAEPPARAESGRPQIAAALGLALGLALLTVPGTLARWWLSQDAVEHLAIAYAWVSGAGFVDPVVWLYPNAGGVPYPGTALRAPMISWLAAIPLGLGATLSTTMGLHALWASAIAGGAIVAARRVGLRLPVATAAVAVFATTPAWIGISLHVWTEATALLAFVAVLATAAGVPGSYGGALRCAVAAFLATLCRPNFVVLAGAVVLAIACEQGVRRSLRDRGCRAFVLSFGAAWIAYRMAIEVVTGEAPYSRYAVLFRVLSTQDAWFYARETPGLGDFLAVHGAELWARALATAVDLVRVTCFESTYHGIGWLAIPGFAFALARGGEHAIPRRFAAFSGIGLALVACLYLDFDRVRFPLFPAVAASLCGFAWLDEAVFGAPARIPMLGSAASAIRIAWPVGLVCVPLAFTLPDLLGRSRDWLGAWRARGTIERLWPELDAAMRPLCRVLEPGAIVASIDPWATHLWCGNAALMLPLDLERPEVLARFTARERPGFIVADASSRALGGSADWIRVGEGEGLVVYRARGVVKGRATVRPQWRLPAPLACAGLDATCGRGF